MAGKSPTSRTLAELRKSGTGCWQIVETFNHWSNTRSDLLGFIDILHICAVPPKIVGIQVTGGGNGSARRTKILTERREKALAFLAAGGEIVIHDWVKRKLKRGGKAMRWRCRVTPITMADFAEVFG